MNFNESHNNKQHSQYYAKHPQHGCFILFRIVNLKLADRSHQVSWLTKNIIKIKTSILHHIVGNPMINLAFGNGLYQPFMVILGMVTFIIGFTTIIHYIPICSFLFAEKSGFTIFHAIFHDISAHHQGVPANPLT